MSKSPSAPRRRPHVEISTNEISPGDHIYTPRILFDHHGIFIGEDQVIHFQNSLDDKALGIGSSIPRHGPCSDCGHHSGKSGVVLSCLNCFLRGGKIYRYEYDYHERFRSLEMMKWSTTEPSDPPEKVIDRAIQKLFGKGMFGDYYLLSNNYEDFALFCKTGKHIRSGQVVFLITLPMAILASVCPFASLFTDWNAWRQNSAKR